MNKVIRPRRPKPGDIINDAYYFRSPFRPSWLYPVGSRLTTKWGTFEVALKYDWADVSSYWKFVGSPR